MTAYSENNNNEEEEKKKSLQRKYLRTASHTRIYFNLQENSKPNEMNEPFLTNQTRKWKAKEKKNTIHTEWCKCMRNFSRTIDR